MQEDNSMNIYFSEILFFCVLSNIIASALNAGYLF